MQRVGVAHGQRRPERRLGIACVFPSVLTPPLLAVVALVATVFLTISADHGKAAATAVCREHMCLSRPRSSTLDSFAPVAEGLNPLSNYRYIRDAAAAPAQQALDALRRLPAAEQVARVNAARAVGACRARATSSQRSRTARCEGLPALRAVTAGIRIACRSSTLLPLRATRHTHRRPHVVRPRHHSRRVRTRRRTHRAGRRPRSHRGVAVAGVPAGPRRRGHRCHDGARRRYRADAVRGAWMRWDGGTCRAGSGSVRRASGGGRCRARGSPSFFTDSWLFAPADSFAALWVAAAFGAVGMAVYIQFTLKL